MNAYQRYMESVHLTQEEHAALLSALEGKPVAPQRGSPLPRLAVCACGLALLAGLGALGLLSQTAGESAAARPSPAQGAVSGAPVVTLYPRTTPDAQLYAGPDTLETTPGAVHLPWSIPAPSEQPDTVIEVLPEDWSLSADGSEYLIDGSTAPPAAEAGLTLEACRALPLLGEHIPDDIPEGFSFASGTSGPDQELTLLWSDGALGEVFLSLSRPEVPPETMDVSDPRCLRRAPL